LLSTPRTASPSRRNLATDPRPKTVLTLTLARSACEEPVHNVGAKPHYVRRALRKKIDVPVHQVISEPREKIETAYFIARTRIRCHHKIIAAEPALLDSSLQQTAQSWASSRIGWRNRIEPLP
jgi:hypothetical protein